MNRLRHGMPAYQLAQYAIADLKSAIIMVLKEAQSEGMTNAEIGRRLGIYQGHIGHEGHIPRTLLAMMENEGVVVQDSQTKKWQLKLQATIDDEAETEL